MLIASASIIGFGQITSSDTFLLKGFMLYLVRSGIPRFGILKSDTVSHADKNKTNIIGRNFFIYYS